jgi:hypothetical protein
MTIELVYIVTYAEYDKQIWLYKYKHKIKQSLTFKH